MLFHVQMLRLAVSTIDSSVDYFQHHLTSDLHYQMSKTIIENAKNLKIPHSLPDITKKRSKSWYLQQPKFDQFTEDKSEKSDPMMTTVLNSLHLFD